MSKKSFSETELENYINKAKQDENIIGFFFGGSRGKGFEDEASDWDLRYIVRDGTKENYCADAHNSNFEPSEYEDMESQVFSYSEFKQHAVGNIKAWDKYSFAHVRALVDKTGDIQTLIDQKWQLSESEANDLVSKHMDSYVHALYRSIKAATRDDAIGQGMQASMSVFHLSQALFASQQRTAPYHNYLSKELKADPLNVFPVDSEELIDLLKEVVTKSTIGAQQRLASVVETYVKRANLYSYERWQDKYDWLMALSR